MSDGFPNLSVARISLAALLVRSVLELALVLVSLRDDELEITSLVNFLVTVMDLCKVLVARCARPRGCVARAAAVATRPKVEISAPRASADAYAEDARAEYVAIHERITSPRGATVVDESAGAGELAAFEARI